MATVDSHDPSEHFTKLDEYQVTMASMLVVLIETMGREVSKYPTLQETLLTVFM